MSSEGECIVTVIARDEDDISTVLSDSLDDVRVESLNDAAALASHIESKNGVDCVVVADDAAELSTVISDARTTDPDTPVVVYRSTATTPPGVALDAGATDAVAADGPDATRVLVNRVEQTVNYRRHEREHAKATSQLDTLFEQIPIHLYIKDTEGRHLRVSNAYTVDPEQYIGKTDVDLGKNEVSRRTFADDMYVINENKPILYKREQVASRTGDWFSIKDLQRHYTETRATSETGESEAWDDGQEEYEAWVMTSKVPWKDGDGNVAGLIGVTVDVSRQENNRRLLERQNARLDEFASVVSHDLRNPLNVASGYVELAQETGNLDYLGQVTRAHQRIDELIEDVLELARGGNDISNQRSVSLDELVAEAWDTVDVDAEATLTVNGPLGTIRADKTRLLALLENLFRNTLDHGASGSPATTDSTASPASETSLTPLTVRVGRLGDGFYVEDDGCGVPDDVREQVFDQGVTTATDGTGFGLAIVERVAEAHGWSVELVDARESTTGARFEIHGAQSSVSPS